MSIATDLAGVRKNLLAIRDCKGKTQCVNLLASSCEGLSTIVGNKAIDRRSVDGRKFLTEIEAGLNTLQGVRNGIEAPTFQTSNDLGGSIGGKLVLHFLKCISKVLDALVVRAEQRGLNDAHTTLHKDLRDSLPQSSQAKHVDVIAVRIRV